MDEYLEDDDFYKEESVCDGCDLDHWEYMFCYSKCYEIYGECPNEDCDPYDI